MGLSPTLTANSDGGFSLAWMQRDEENLRNLSDIYVRTFNSLGLPLTDNQRHNTWLRGQQVEPELVQLGDETLVVWTSYGQDDSGGGIQGRLISGGREFQVNSQGRMHQRAPSVATDGSSKFLAVWVNTVSPTHSILSGQRYVNSDGDLSGVVDVTSGKVEVIAASEKRRRATPVVKPGRTETADVLNTGTEILNPMKSVVPLSVDLSDKIDDKPIVTPVSVPVPAPAQSAPVERSSTVGRHVLLAAARQRSVGARSMMTRSSNTYAQSRARQPAASAYPRSFAQRMASLQPTTPRLSVASRQSPQPSYQRASSWRAGLASSRASQPIASAATRRTLTSAVSRYNTVMRNSLSRTSMATQRAQPKPVATSLHRTDDGLSIKWTSRSGARYQVQGSNNLSQWTNIGAARGGTGTRDSKDINSTNGGPRYYRVVRVD